MKPLTSDTFQSNLISTPGCDNPDPIANGSYVESLTNEYVMGDQLTYTCDAGFSETYDSRVIECDSGEWSPSPPVCLRGNLHDATTIKLRIVTISASI